MTEAISRLADRLALQDLMARYARGVDRRDWDAVRDTFHPDAHDDHGEYQGGVDGFIEWVSRRHQNIPQSMHFLGNCLIEFAGEGSALVETYFIAMQRIPADAEAAQTMLEQAGAGGKKQAVDVDVLGRYIDHAERRNGEWRTARRVVAFDSMRTKPAGSGALSPDWALALRDQNDPVYTMRAALGLS